MSAARNPNTRLRLARILGLPESASDAELRLAATHLLGVLRRRQVIQRAQPVSGGIGEDPADTASSREADSALAAEIAELASSVERLAGSGSEVLPRAGRIDRYSLVGALLGATFMLAVLIAYANGDRFVWQESQGATTPLEEPATLMMLGRLPGATLRVFDADRDELFVKTVAAGAIVELSPRRYALEVSREDCPDRWTRSVYFEAGSTHRFEPSLCVGQGQVTIRSSVTDDRLIIDGIDVGATGPEPHTLSVGDHEIRIEKPGYVAYESTVRIEPDADLQLRAELEIQGKQRPGSRDGFPLPFETSALTTTTQDLMKPEPFDFEELRQTIAPPKSGSPRMRLLQREGLPGLPDGGSTAWHDRISAELLTRFDGDGSGLIDQLAESDSISCPLWQEIEQDFERGGLGLSMARYFGFDGTEWHPNALGFAREMRSVAYAKMKECGLQT